MKWIKQLFGIKEDDVKLGEKFENASATNELVISPRKQAANKKQKQTKASLGKMSKVQIDELAKNELGVELDRRKKKDSMIEDYLAAQKEAV